MIYSIPAIEAQNGMGSSLLPSYFFLGAAARRYRSRF